MGRKIIFWLHLGSGLIAGIAIAIMCATGVVLSFEKQLVAWAERDVRLTTPPAAGASRLSLAELTRRVEAVRPDTRPTSITFSANPRSAVAFTFGRDDIVYVNPHTGDVRTPASTKMRNFTRTMTEWHRWLAFSEDYRVTGKLINGICNGAFCVLAISGLYLWIPRTWSWRGVRAVACLNWRLEGKARDFNWHNTIGLWSSPILILLTLTALPMSFRWANVLVYRIAGDEPPAQQGPGAPTAPLIEITKPSPDARPLERDALVAAVQMQFPAWEEITWRSSNPRGRENSPSSKPQAPGTSDARRGASPQAAVFTVKLPGAWPRTATTTVSLNPYSGDTLRTEGFADLTAGRRLRTWTRFLHTGEALGWPGQLAAGFATLGGCFLVYTGFALSWRRFFGKRAA